MHKNSEFINKLRSSGLRPTKQRLKICEVLFNRDKTFHFTINDLAKDISEQLKANTSGKFALDQMINSPIVDDDGNVTTLLVPRDGFHEMCWFTIRAFKNPSHRRTNTFVENEDYIDRRFGIKVYSNSSSDRNEVILDYVDITNKDNVANTDTAFVNKDRVAITNREHLALGYANGTFKNQA